MSDAIVLPEQKRCPKCGDDKPRSEFYKSNRTKDGLHGICKRCHGQVTKAWGERNKDRLDETRKKWRASNQEKLREIAKRHYDKAAKDPDFLAKAAARAKEWYWKNREYSLEVSKRFRAENKERMSEWYRAYYKLNADRIKAATKAYAEANPEKTRQWSIATQHRRRLAKATSESHFTAADVDRLMALQRGRCANCGKNLSKGHHVDHKMPVSKGGDNSRLNIELLCPPCNRSKAAKLPHEFAAENGRLL